MKKLLILILLLLFPINSTAFMFFGDHTPVSGICTTPDNGDELDEGFPNPTDLTWTDTGATISIGADLPGTGPSGTWDTCDTGARFQADNSTPWKYHNLGSSIARSNDIVITTIFYANAASLTGFGTNVVLSFNNSTTPDNNLLGKLSFRYTSGSNYTFWAVGDTNSSHITVALSTYYKLTLTLDGAHGATGSSLDVDSWNGSSWDAVGNETFQRYDANDAQYVHVGPYSGVGVGETLDMYVGLISINTP